MKQGAIVTVRTEPKRMMRRVPADALRALALFAASAASPALALDIDLAGLLANPDAIPEAAIAACATGVTDPAQADAALTGAGWSKTEGDSDGVHEYAKGETWVMMWDEPGFCMAASSLTTAEYWDALHALTYHSLKTGVSADGCDMAALPGNVTVTLSGPGNDPACSSRQGSALRFEISN